MQVPDGDVIAATTRRKSDVIAVGSFHACSPRPMRITKVGVARSMPERPGPAAAAPVCGRPETDVRTLEYRQWERATGGARGRCVSRVQIEFSGCQRRRCLAYTLNPDTGWKSAMARLPLRPTLMPPRPRSASAPCAVYQSCKRFVHQRTMRQLRLLNHVSWAFAASLRHSNISFPPDRQDDPQMNSALLQIKWTSDQPILYWALFPMGQNAQDGWNMLSSFGEVRSCGVVRVILAGHACTHRWRRVV